MQGATCYCYVPLTHFGQFLHQLENVSDVFVVGQEHYRHLNRSIVELRSDRWPDDWHGKDVEPVLVGEAIVDFKLIA